jgi:two-component system chemotaxis response regulator CheB
MSRTDPIRVLVIDDSAFSRRMITRMLKASPLVEVVDVARDGEDALRKAMELRPDLITLDLEMPRMGGFTFLRILMARCPTPVIVISGRSSDPEVFQALELGAVDFIAKPTARATPHLASIERELIRKVHASRQLRMDRVRRRLSALPPLVSAPAGPADSAPRVVAIGASTGGPAALMQIFGAFPDPPACAFLVAQHMPEGFTRGFADRIDRLTNLRAAEARGGEALAAGTVWVAPGGRHLELENRAGRVVTRVVPTLRRDKYAPSVDRLFESAAKHLGADVLAVVLTGMGDDGRAGVGAVKAAGGRAIAESEETAVVFGMPKQAIRTGAVDRVLPLGEIAGAIQEGRAGDGGSPSRRGSLGR